MLEQAASELLLFMKQALVSQFTNLNAKTTARHLKVRQCLPLTRSTLSSHHDGRPKPIKSVFLHNDYSWRNGANDA